MEPAGRLSRLTARQREILDIACGEGLPCKGIADRLGISPHTVVNHLSDRRGVYRRLGVPCLARACAVWGAHQRAGIRARNRRLAGKREKAKEERR